jgi:hypothetical protein
LTRTKNKKQSAQIAKAERKLTRTKNKKQSAQIAKAERKQSAP